MTKRKKSKKASNTFLSTTWEYFKVITSALILALLIRFFLVEPYKIPSGSMVPTLLIGDYLFVNKLTYNIHIPFTDIYLREKTPERGDIVVFKREVENLPKAWFGFGSTYFIKRVVAVPGDTVQYLEKTLIVNGEPAQTEPQSHYMYVDSHGEQVDAELHLETINGYSHDILKKDEVPSQNLRQSTVPEGMLVVMGDNRDNSGDSRMWNRPRWGYVPQRDVLGRAEFIFWSWNNNYVPRLERIFNYLHPEHLYDTLDEEAIEGTYVQ